MLFSTCFLDTIDTFLRKSKMVRNRKFHDQLKLIFSLQQDQNYSIMVL